MLRTSLYTILTLLLLSVASGCKKNERPFFPEVAFEQYIYLNNPSSFPLSAPTGFIYSEGGYRGLIVYRRTGETTVNGYIAFDRGCPSHYDEDCGHLDVSADGIYAVCRCNGEQYLLNDGSPAADASLPLRQYQLSLNGNILVIRN